MHFDVAIAGGGIVGCACALACAKRGFSVALAERDVLGSGATAAGMGHIVVMDDSEAQFALTRHSQQLWHALNLSAAAEYVQAGTLWIAADGEEMEAAERKHAWYSARGVPSRLLNASQLKAVEPNLADGLTGGLLVQEDSVVYPPVAALELARRAEKNGAHLIVGRAVKDIGQGRIVLDDGTEIRANRLIHALGAYATDLMPELPVRKRKGHLVITDRYPGFVIGSSRQYGAEDTAIDRQLLGRMLARAAVYMPAIADLNIIRVWTGFRAATPDKLPLIGPAPGDSTLWLATGHEGLGITTALATAELLADAFTGRAPAIAPEPYLPMRFERTTTTAYAIREEL
jgi:D-hydroxyproline dehydrogenase subunit beta